MDLSNYSPVRSSFFSLKKLKKGETFKYNTRNDDDNNDNNNNNTFLINNSNINRNINQQLVLVNWYVKRNSNKYNITLVLVILISGLFKIESQAKHQLVHAPSA